MHCSSKWSFLSLFSQFFRPLFSFPLIHLISIAAQGPQVHLIVIASLIQSPYEAFNCSWHHTSHWTEKITYSWCRMKRERQGEGEDEQRENWASRLWDFKSQTGHTNLEGERGTSIDWEPRCARDSARGFTWLIASNPCSMVKRKAFPKGCYIHS